MKIIEYLIFIIICNFLYVYYGAFHFSDYSHNLIILLYNINVITLNYQRMFYLYFLGSDQIKYTLII